jgi:hypothetical protein
VFVSVCSSISIECASTENFPPTVDIIPVTIEAA